MQTAFAEGSVGSWPLSATVAAHSKAPLQRGAESSVKGIDSAGVPLRVELARLALLLHDALNGPVRSLIRSAESIADELRELALSVSTPEQREAEANALSLSDASSTNDSGERPSQLHSGAVRASSRRADLFGASRTGESRQLATRAGRPLTSSPFRSEPGLSSSGSFRVTSSPFRSEPGPSSSDSFRRAARAQPIKFKLKAPAPQNAVAASAASGSSVSPLSAWEQATAKAMATSLVPLTGPVAGSSMDLPPVPAKEKNVNVHIPIVSGGSTWSFASAPTVTKLPHRRTGELVGHSNKVYSLARLEDGRLASGSADMTIKLWNLEEQKCLFTLCGHTGTVWAVEAVGHHTLASASGDTTVKLWDVAATKCVGTLTGHGGHVYSLAKLDARKFASGSGDRSIKVWEKDAGACLATLTGHGDAVLGLAAVIQGRLASCSGDKTIKLWDVENWSCLATLVGHSDWVCALAPLGDGGQLASGSKDRTVKLWDVVEPRCLGSLDGHRDVVYALTPLGADGRIIASGSDDTMVKLWDLDMGRCLGTLKNDQTENDGGESNFCLCLLALPGGQLVRGGAARGTIEIWAA